MKNKLFINLYSYGKNSTEKWNKVASSFPDLEPVFLPPEQLTAEIRNYIWQNDTVFIGGGDGTLHHLVNSVLQSEDDFKRVRVGVLGLGSSCSFLKSLPAVKKISDVPVMADLGKSSYIDIGRVQFKDLNGDWHTKYFVANGSVGFLALGNLLFNQQGGLTETLKRMSTEVANNFVFLKGLMKYAPVPISINGEPSKFYLNIQFLKSKYYTGDFYFERGNSLRSGLLDFHIFDYLGVFDTLKVFVSLMSKNEYTGASHKDYRDKQMHLRSDYILPLELDGEIYYGSEFKIDCLPQRLQIMSQVSL
jgi:diacylglycerol kinase family enzyme